MTGFGAYLKPKLIVVLLLGFSSGLPRLLIASTLSAWLSDSNIERAAIGLFAYVSLPYSFNFLWAPFIDNLRLPLFSRLGRRVGWGIFAQMMVAGSLIWLGLSDPAIAPAMTALAALSVAFFSASQDVVIDAYRTEYLESAYYGQGAANAVFGYRLGMLVAGAGALFFADHIPWTQVYFIMAAFMLVGMITLLLSGEPIVATSSPESHSDSRAISTNAAHDSPRIATGNSGNDVKANFFHHAVIEPFTEFARAHPHWLLILLLIAFYRMPDGFIGFMATPFMLDIGFSKTEVASISKLYGFIAMTIGTIAGGALVGKWGLWRALFWFGIMQVLANLSYLLLASYGAEIALLMVTISLDQLAGGLVTAAAIAYMMKLCDPRFTATQYALLASLASLASILLAGAAGWVADQYGWPAMFSLSAFMGLPALALLLRLKGHVSFETPDKAEGEEARIVNRDNG